MFYGYREGEEPDADDEDLQLIPRLVETVILAKITGKTPGYDRDSLDALLTVFLPSLRPAPGCLGSAVCLPDSKSSWPVEEVI